MIKPVAAISFVYDLSAGLTLLLLRGPAVSLVPGLAPLLTPAPLLADLLGLFLTCVAAGYLLPYRQPQAYRSYMWIFGVALKTAGAIVFLADYRTPSASALMPLFAASDGALAVLTLAALVSDRGGSKGRAECPPR